LPLDDKAGAAFLERLIPFLDDKSKGTLFQKILDGETDWHLIKALNLNTFHYILKACYRTGF